MLHFLRYKRLKKKLQCSGGSIFSDMLHFLRIKWYHKIATQAGVLGMSLSYSEIWTRWLFQRIYNSTRAFLLLFLLLLAFFHMLWSIYFSFLPRFRSFEVVGYTWKLEKLEISGKPISLVLRQVLQTSASSFHPVIVFTMSPNLRNLARRRRSTHAARSWLDQLVSFWNKLGSTVIKGDKVFRAFMFPG